MAHLRILAILLVQLSCTALPASCAPAADSNVAVPYAPSKDFRRLHLEALHTPPAPTWHVAAPAPRDEDVLIETIPVLVQPRPADLFPPMPTQLDLPEGTDPKWHSIGHQSGRRDLTYWFGPPVDCRELRGQILWCFESRQDALMYSLRGYTSIIARHLSLLNSDSPHTAIADIRSALPDWNHAYVERMRIFQLMALHANADRDRKSSKLCQAMGTRSAKASEVGKIMRTLALNEKLLGSAALLEEK